MDRFRPPNPVTVTFTDGQSLNVRFVARCPDRPWVYAKRISQNDREDSDSNSTDEIKELTFRAKEIRSIESEEILNPSNAFFDIRIHCETGISQNRVNEILRNHNNANFPKANSKNSNDDSQSESSSEIESIKSPALQSDRMQSLD